MIKLFKILLHKSNQFYNTVKKVKPLISEKRRVCLLKDVCHCSTKIMIEKLLQLRLMVSLVESC